MITMLRSLKLEGYQEKLMQSHLIQMNRKGL